MLAEYAYKNERSGACQKSITDNGNTELETTSCVKELFIFIQTWVYFQI